MEIHWLTFSADSSSITIYLESCVCPQANKSLILFTLFCSPLTLEGKVRFSCSVFSDSVLPRSPTVFQPMIWTHCFDVGQVSFSIIKHLLTYDTQRGVDMPCPAKAKIKVAVATVFSSFFSTYKYLLSLPSVFNSSVTNPTLTLLLPMTLGNHNKSLLFLLNIREQKISFWHTSNTRSVFSKKVSFAFLRSTGLRFGGFD